MTRATRKIQNYVIYILVNITETDSQANFTKNGQSRQIRGKQHGKRRLRRRINLIVGRFISFVVKGQDVEQLV